MPGRDGKYPADPPPHHWFDLPDPRPDVPPDAVRVYRGRREDRAPPRLVQQMPVVVAENGHVGRVDHEVVVERVLAPAVVRVHPAAAQTGVEGRRASEVLLLRPGTFEEATPGRGGRGEVQGGRLVPGLEQAARCG